jgi:hypothetical protein
MQQLESPKVQSPTHNTSATITWRSAGLFAVRYGIGGVMVLAGVVALIVVGGDMGAYGFASAIGAGLSVVLLNLLYRLSVSGDREREREEEARRYLDEHGVWPEDAGAQPQTRTRRWTVPRGAILAEHEQQGDRPPRGGRVPADVPGTP